MVQLRVQPTREESVPRDTFVSIRFGQSQKLSRLDGSRSYKFSQTGDIRYGKIEVFRRIGVASLDMYQSFGAAQEINVDCAENDLGQLGLKVMVEPEETEKKHIEAKTQEREGATLDAKVKSAKQYLNKHGLELQLSEAMQDILRDRPENPAEYLAEQLLKHSGAHRLPPMKPSEKESKAPMFNSPVAPTDEPINVAPRPHAARPQMPEPLTPSTTVSAEAPNLPRPDVTGAVEAKQNAEDAALENPRFDRLASVVTWMTPRGKPQCVRDLTETQRQEPTPAQQAQQSATAFHLKPSVSSWCSFIPHVAGEVAEDEEDEPARAVAQATTMKPSVGGWLAPLPVACEAPHLEKPTSDVFKHLPSVGAWLAPSPASVDEDEGVGETPVAISTASYEGVRYCVRPSVGSWLAPAPVVDPEDGIVVTSDEAVVDTKGFKFKPSVGGWLNLPSLDQEFVTQPASPHSSKQKYMAPLQGILGQNFYSLGIRPGVKLI